MLLMALAGNGIRHGSAFIKLTVQYTHYILYSDQFTTTGGSTVSYI